MLDRDKVPGSPTQDRRSPSGWEKKRGKRKVSLGLEPRSPEGLSEHLEYKDLASESDVITTYTMKPDSCVDRIHVQLCCVYGRRSSRDAMKPKKGLQRSDPNSLFFASPLRPSTYSALLLLLRLFLLQICALVSRLYPLSPR